MVLRKRSGKIGLARTCDVATETPARTTMKRLFRLTLLTARYSFRCQYDTCKHRLIVVAARAEEVSSKDFARSTPEKRTARVRATRK